MGISIMKVGTDAALSALSDIVPIGDIWYAKDIDKYVIGTGAATYSNLNKMTYDEVKNLSLKGYPPKEVDGGSLD